jgi:outer membrane lipoprotein-sorting protein
MNCQETIYRMTDLLDKEQGPKAELVREHLANCPACRVRFEEHEHIFESVRRARRIAASHQFGAKTMKAIANEAALEATTTGKFWHLQGWRRWAVAACATALLIFLLPSLAPHFGGRRSASAVLAQSIEAMSNVQTIHMTGRMRTIPGDNFELIGAEYDFVPLELWREYNPSRWRVEKPGRVVVMDGTSSTLYISQLNQYMKASTQAGFVEWLRPLLNPESILQNELDSTKMKPSDATVTESNGNVTLTVRRKAEGSFANTWTKNKSIDESDHTCIYKFDSATKRLQALQVVIHTGSQDVPVLELNDIRYNETPPDKLFALQIPEGATQIIAPEQMSSAVDAILGPKDAAEYFFNALAQKDWNAVLGVYPTSTVPDLVKSYYGGLSILSIGVPFKSGIYAGYFVPYRIRLYDGTVISHNLAVRNDNPQKRWVVDGGF